MKKLRIFLVDDHEIVREGLRLLLERQPDMEVIGHAGCGESAAPLVAALKPDVIVLDISMPGMQGWDAAREFKRINPQSKLVVLTVHEDDSYVRRLVKAGASGYVLKRSAANELTQAIRIVAGGGVYLNTEGSSEVLETAAQMPAHDASESKLSEREKTVLCLIASGYSNKEIAAKLDISVKTVETYKTRLMEKLRLASRVEIVRYALQRGWLQS